MWFLGLAAALLLPAGGCDRRRTEGGVPVVRVGSKKFTESEILGEVLCYLAEEAGARAEHRKSLGDTSTVWQALRIGEIDVYCEYTGTLTQDILTGRKLPDEKALRDALTEQGLRMSRPLGFNNSYALAMKRARAAELGIRKISDLRQHPELKFGLSNTFLDREKDGWEPLRRRYGLPQTEPKGIEHELSYQAVQNGSKDVTDVYTTDAKLRTYDFLILEDDRHFFPVYDAVLVYRADLEGRVPAVVKSLLRLEGAIPEKTMIDMNARAEMDRVPDKQVAADFLAHAVDVHPTVVLDTLHRRLLVLTGQHLRMVVLSLVIAIAVAVPLGIAGAHWPALGQAILAVVGVVQTLPALALLGLLIWLLGQIGLVPAVVALFLYSLLPIVRNTYTGLRDIPLQIRESAEALGLTPLARLNLIELPLASRSILAGIKTAAVINVGFATLGGLIGAGGYGQPILVGLNRNNNSLILEGAIPAVVLALLVQALFEVAERFLVPKGLRLEASR
jgi:osmoprotectant transport system permease protein